MDELQPANALYLVQGEISCIVTEMKRSIRSSSHSPVSYSSLSLISLEVSNVLTCCTIECVSGGWSSESWLSVLYTYLLV